MTENELDQLLEAARQASERAHAPYSRFRVGAAVRTPAGNVYRGCNVENASYGATICAERGAVSQMVAAGEHAIEAVAVWVDAPEPAMPCGICRQVLAEFAADATIVCGNPSGRQVVRLSELLPHAFKLQP